MSVGIDWLAPAMTACGRQAAAPSERFAAVRRRCDTAARAGRLKGAAKVGISPANRRRAEPRLNSIAKVTEMNDVTALMGKLKSTVAYLQFDDPMTEARSYRPVADRADDRPPAGARPSLALGRYAPAADTRALADIFARLERTAS